MLCYKNVWLKITILVSIAKFITFFLAYIRIFS